MKSRGGFEPIELQPGHRLNPCEGRNPLPMGKVCRMAVCVADNHIVVLEGIRVTSRVFLVVLIGLHPEKVGTP